MAKRAKKEGNSSGSQGMGTQYSGRDGGDSDAYEAVDTGVAARRNAAVSNVLEPQSANAHRAHRAIPSTWRARKEKGE